jgi:membrane protease YdiL (CAAX protease family)
MLGTALAIPEAFALLPGESTSNASVQLLTHLTYCTTVVLAIWAALRMDGLGLRAVGLERPRSSSVAWGLGLWAFGAFVVPFVTAPLFHLVDIDVRSGMTSLAQMPLWLRLVVALTSGPTEELLYRGFAIDQLTRLFGQPWVAGAVAATIFGLAHVPTWGLGFALAADLPMGIYMTAFYIWHRDLAANMFAHALGLVVAMSSIGP